MHDETTDIVPFEQLPDIIKSHIWTLYSLPNLIKGSKGTHEHIIRRLIQHCADIDCRDAMKYAFEWLIQSGQICVVEVKHKKRKDLDGLIYRLKWHLPKTEIGEGKNIGDCAICHEKKYLISNEDRSLMICPRCKHIEAD